MESCSRRVAKEGYQIESVALVIDERKSVFDIEGAQASGPRLFPVIDVRTPANSGRRLIFNMSLCSASATEHSSPAKKVARGDNFRSDRLV